MIPFNQPMAVADTPDCGPVVYSALQELRVRCCAGEIKIFEDEAEMHQVFFDHLRQKMKEHGMPSPTKKERERFSGILESKEHIDIVCGNVAVELKYKPMPFDFPELGKARPRKGTPKFEKAKHVEGKDGVCNDIRKMRILIKERARTNITLGYAVVLTSRKLTAGAEDALKAAAHLKDAGEWANYGGVLTRYFILEVRP